MNARLLGTTLLGALTIANTASAESPKITVGGIADFQLGVANDDQDALQRSSAFRSDTEVSFKVDGKSDAGFGYGAEIWLEADTTADADTQGLNASRTFIYLDGQWGRFEMGSNLGAEQTLKIGAESIARATGGIDGDWRYFANSSTSFIATPDLPLNYGNAGGLGNEATENLNKITYYSPRFSGFQLGLSYLPDQETRGQTIVRTDTTTWQSKNIFTGGINWEGKLDPVTIGLAATGELGNAETSGNEDLRAWTVGGKLGFMGFTLAGSYGNWTDSNVASVYNADDSYYWTLGGAYEYNAFGISVTYLRSTLDVNLTPTVGWENKFSNLSIGADYKLAPGMTPYAEVSFYRQNPGILSDNDGSVLLVGTQLNF